MGREYADGYRAKRQADRSRVLAVQLLDEIDRKDSFTNLVLPRALRQEQKANPRFTFRDAAFTSELVYGTIRQRGYLDTILAALSSRPLAELEPVVLQILRVGAYQLLFMRVPDHAAVAETVDVARQLSTDGPVKMVNAILRSITRSTPEQTAAIFEAIEDPVAQMAARHSHPEWIVRSFDQALTERGLGKELAEALDANNAAPRVNLVARPGLISASELSAEAEAVLDRGTSQGQVSEYAVILDGGDPAALPSVREGRAAVQDEGSQLAALMLAGAWVDGEDRRWLDLCAGPGGKTALLAAIGKERGVSVVANEVSEHRARLVERSVRALDNIQVILGDGRTMPTPVDGPFDRVLVDAPCTGLGSLRRRPESRWRHSQSDVEELLPLQRALLTRGIELTRPGGVLAWVTCTPQVEETLDQVQWALAEGQVSLLDGVEIAASHMVIDFSSGDNLGDLPADRRLLVSQTVQLWPHRHGTDAMFIALFRKESTA